MIKMKFMTTNNNKICNNKNVTNLSEENSKEQEDTTKKLSA